MSLSYKSNLRALDGPVDYVVVSVREYMDLLAPLISHRQSQGLRTLLVDVEDIWDEYADGRFDPVAIRRFLDDVRSKCGGSGPPYVFVVGDATYDYFGAVSTEKNQVPTYHSSAVVTHFAGDRTPIFPHEDYFVGATADGTAPYTAIGRLPARDRATVQAYVAKVLEHESSVQSCVRRERIRGLFIATANFQGFCKLVEKALPSESEVYRLFNDGTSEGAVQIQDAIVQRVNGGVDMMYFVGHGSGNAWSTGLAGNKEFFFTNRHVVDLKNKGSYPIVFAASCYSAIFDTPPVEWRIQDTGIGVALVEASESGAIVFIGSGDKVSVSGGHFFVERFVTAALSGGCSRVGDAFFEAKQEDYDREAMGMQLIGDPAVVLPCAWRHESEEVLTSCVEK